jgi:methanethiol S-methyltransferase
VPNKYLLGQGGYGYNGIQKNHKLAVTGPYAWLRHTQYVGFIIIMFGFLLQWPTMLTLLMFPVLVYMYIRLARWEEREVTEEFGNEYKIYAEKNPFFYSTLW